MGYQHHFTEGEILRPLLRFTLPILLAVCFQAMYGAVDLVVVGHFGTAADVAAVANGSRVMETVAFFTASLSMGTTVLLGRKLGQNREEEIGAVVGGSVCLFAVTALILTVSLTALAGPVVSLMKTPPEAVEKTVAYLRICAGGSVCIVAYNVLGSVFRGLGDARTPLIAAGAACGLNIGVDLLLERIFGMPAICAAWATVLSQAVSVVLCVLLVRRRKTPFPLRRADLRFDRTVIRQTLALGGPVALQDLLSDGALLVVLTIVNTLGVTVSAAVGVAEKLMSLLILVPTAYMEALSAFTAQNAAAGREDRARRAMWYGMAIFSCVGVVLAGLVVTRGDALLGLFGRNDAAVTAAAWSYLQGGAQDLLLASVLFCFLGYFDGCGRTKFVMVQGVLGAFCIRVPFSYALSRLEGVSLFQLGLAAPCATAMKILLCLIYFQWLRRAGTSVRANDAAPLKK